MSNFAQILYHTFSKMLIEIIININAEIKNKLWNNFILNRLNVKLYYNFCKNEK